MTGPAPNHSGPGTRPEILVADLSHNNSLASLRLLVELGLAGVIHKATQGLTFADDRYASRRAEASDLGLPFGSYHFGTDTDGKTQADHFLAVSGGDGLKVLDVEANGPHTMSLRQAEDFVARVAGLTGDSPGIYSGQSFLSDLSRGISKESPLLKCWLWIARYSMKAPLVPPIFGKSWTLWQFTDRGLPPIGLDLSRFQGDARAFRAFWKLPDPAE